MPHLKKELLLSLPGIRLLTSLSLVFAMDPNFRTSWSTVELLEGLSACLLLSVELFPNLMVDL